MTLNGIGGAIQLAQMDVKLQAQHEMIESQNLRRRFREMITRVLQTIHLDRDNYGLISSTELNEQVEFKDKIQAICKEYL